MHGGNRQGHRVISISQKRVDQPCVPLPFSSTNGSVFICVCIQRSELPFKMIQKGHRLHRLLSEGEKDGRRGGNTLNIASQHLKAMTMHMLPA